MKTPRVTHLHLLALVGLAAAVLLVVNAPSASAATCTNTWAGSSSGLWNVSANWNDGDGDPNNNVPGFGDVACINQPGTYTVTIIDNGVTNSGSTDVLELGDGDTGNGVVTLAVLSSTTGGGNPLEGALNLVSATTSSTIRSDGVVELSGSGANPGQTYFQSSNDVDNSGVIRSIAGAGGNRLLNIGLNNLAGGTVDIQYDAVQGFTRTWTNNGTFEVANGAKFTITGSGGGPTFNQTNGTLDTNTTGVFFQTGGFFNHTGGTQTGNPVQLCGPQLQAPSGGAGTYDFVRVPSSFCGGGTISGDIAANKTVRMNNASNGTMGVSLVNNLTNNGTLILTGTEENQLLGGKTLTNAGTLQVTGTGARLFGNTITNTGTIAIDQDANFGFTPTITNNGTLAIADGKTLYITGSGQGPTFNQAGGTLNTNTTGVLFHNGGFFNHTGGTQTGNPVQLCGPQLQAPSGGAGTYDFVRVPSSFCGGGTISGDIAANKTVRMNNASNGTMGVSLVNNLTNNGTLILTGTEENQLLGGKTLTNAGTLLVEGTGARLFGNSITNAVTGTIAIYQDTNFGFTPTVTNSGALTVVAGETLYITGSGSGPVFNQSGTLNVLGTFNNGGAYNTTGGTTTVQSGGQIISSTTIALTGGTLRGTGTVTTPTLNNSGGTVRPGSSPGVLTLSGNYVQSVGGTLAIDIAGTAVGTGYSRLVVSGNVSLAGELGVTNTIQPAGGQQFQVVTGNVSGTFGSVSLSGPPSYDIAYNPGDVTLTAKAPAAPTLSGTSPASGADDNTPRILGTAPTGSTVALYNNDTCTGSPVATGTAAELTAPGIEVTVADNSTTTIHATATDDDNTSTCSTSSVTYVEKSPPSAPTLTGTSPTSGADNNSPRILGTASAGSTVALFTNANCTGSPVATGSAAQLAAPGIEVTVADNSTTTLHATATDANGTSACSTTSVTYVESSADPIPPPVTPGKVSLTKKPPKKSTKKVAKFRFSAPDAATYSCKLDKKPFKACTSPIKYSKLKSGKHTFTVRGIGAGGQQGPTTKFTWKVKKK